MLKANLSISKSITFAIVSVLKRGFSHEGTLCKSATVPAAVILGESAYYTTVHLAWEGDAKER